MNVTCTNKKCKIEFQLEINNLSRDSNRSGNHTTQHLISGTIYCPSCSNEMEIEYLYDELDDTGEILSEKVLSLA